MNATENNKSALADATVCPACGSSAITFTRTAYEEATGESLARGDAPDYFVHGVKDELVCRLCDHKSEEVRGSIPHVSFIRKSTQVVVR